MEERSWRRNNKGETMKEKYWGKIIEEKSWRRNIEKSWRRNHGREIMEE